MFLIGEQVEKTGGDYYFRGHVVASFKKLSGAYRCVVENSDGVLFIFNDKQLELVYKHE